MRIGNCGDMARPIPTIAILDDEDAYRRALSRLLRAHGYRVEDFSTGEALVARTLQTGVACALIDLYMPGMSGFDVLEALRRNPRAPPVIVITAHDDPDSMRRAAALNAFECRAKPIAAAALVDLIERALCR